jgi:hypothetical protein
LVISALQNFTVSKNGSPLHFLLHFTAAAVFLDNMLHLYLSCLAASSKAGGPYQLKHGGVDKSISRKKKLKGTRIARPLLLQLQSYCFAFPSRFPVGNSASRASNEALIFSGHDFPQCEAKLSERSMIFTLFSRCFVVSPCQEGRNVQRPGEL